MVLWICGGVVVIAVAVLGVLLLELRAKKTRLDAAIEQAQTRTAPAISIVKTLADTPKPTLRIAKAERTLVGHTADRGE